MRAASAPTSIQAISVHPVSAFADNYLWVLHDGTRALVVDPGDATPVIEFLVAHSLSLEAILVTHHHHDHVGGIAALLDFFPSTVPIPVFGPAKENIPLRTHALGNGDFVSAVGVEFAVWDVPGHTAGHIAYHCAQLGLLFSGDTIFACGCGRILGGNALDFHASLARIMALPDATKIYCTHEYTMANIKFALSVEPDNAELQARARAEAAKRERGVPTVPTTVGLERATNPFVRWDVEAIRVITKPHVNRHSSDENSPNTPPSLVFGKLRSMKDDFK